MGRTGIVLYHGIDSGAELAGYGRLAEDAGFDSLWVTERYFHEETFSMLGYLAARTERIGLGVGVVNPYTRSPALLGMGAATIDRLSGGRLMLGLGRSDVEVIEGRMGIDYAAPLARLRGTVGALRSMWSGERVSSEYAGVRLREVGLALRPVQGRLPIYLAAIGPRALRLAGEVADGVLLNAYAPVEYVRWAAAEVRRAAREAGREPGSVDVACMLIVRLTDDPESLMQGLRERVARLISEPYTGDRAAWPGRIRRVYPRSGEGAGGKGRRGRGVEVRVGGACGGVLPAGGCVALPGADPGVRGRGCGQSSAASEAGGVWGYCGGSWSGYLATGHWHNWREHSALRRGSSMKYFGDQRDYFKFDLVIDLAFCLLPKPRFTNIVMLTPDDDSTHGQVICYKVGNGRSSLYKFLQRCAKAPNRSVQDLRSYFNEAREKVEYLPYKDDAFFSAHSRSTYFANVQQKSLENAVILLDPDTGLLPRTGKKTSSDHVLSSEVLGLKSRMDTSSVLVLFQWRGQGRKWNDLFNYTEKCLGSFNAVFQSNLAFICLAKCSSTRKTLNECLRNYAARNNLKLEER